MAAYDTPYRMHLSRVLHLDDPRLLQDHEAHQLGECNHDLIFNPFHSQHSDLKCFIVSLTDVAPFSLLLC